jgi:hypothetical protein
MIERQQDTNGHCTGKRQATPKFYPILGSPFWQSVQPSSLLDRRRVSRNGDPATLGQSALDSNGPFAVFILKDSGVVFVTDAGASIPIYWGSGLKGVATGTLCNTSHVHPGRRIWISSPPWAFS